MEAIRPENGKCGVVLERIVGTRKGEKMNRDDASKALHGREYPLELDDAFEDILKENNLVVVLGASDDLMEFRGAIYDEVGAYGGGVAYLTDKGLLSNECHEGDCCPYFAEVKKQAKVISALWCKESGYSWTYETEIPHSTFDVIEDDELYCRGIVFSLGDV